MKRVYLYAYDKVNLGDDLFIRTIVKRYPGVRFIFWSSAENKLTFKDLSNLSVLDNDSRLMKFFGKVRTSIPGRIKTFMEKHSDAFVYIGGSIFIEYPYWEYFVEWWKGKAENTKGFAIGANFGPYKTEEYPKKLRVAFNKMNDICFRDRYSYELFADCENVRYAPDILFSYPMPDLAVRNKQVFISVIDCLGKDESHNLSALDEKYTRMISEIMMGYIDNGYNIIISSFCKAEGDENAIERIMGYIKDDFARMVSIKNYNGTNADEILAAIASSEYVIGTRFHAIVLGLTAGRPVLPIIYSDKTKNVLDDIGFKGVAFDLRSDGEIDYRTCQEHFEKYVTIRIDALKKQSNEHFRELDKLLLKE